jgi:hypothetical protein
MSTKLRCLLLVLTLAWPAAAAADGFQAGEEALVRSHRAAVQKGDRVLAWVRWGTRLQIDAVQGDWCRVTASPEVLTQPEAPSVTGWVHAENLVRPPTVEGIEARKAHAAFVELAAVLADALTLATDKPPRPLTHIEVVAATRDAITKLEDLEKGTDGYVKNLCRQTREEMQLALATARSLDENPVVREMLSNSGTPDELTVSGSLSLTGPSLCVNYRTVFDAKEVDREVAQLRLKLAGATEQLQVFRHMFAKHLPGHAGSARRISGAVLLPSFSSCPLSDKLELLNASGHDLTHAILYVEVGKGDDKAVSLHYLPRWPAGTAAYAWYSKGVRLGNKSFAHQSLPDVDTVTVSVYAEELSQTDVVYRYDREERQHALKAYYDQVTVKLGFSRNPGASDNTNQGYFSIDVAGVPALGKGRMKVSFYQDGAWEQVIFVDQKRPDGMYTAAAYQLTGTPNAQEFDVWEKGKRKDVFITIPVWKALKPEKIKVEFEVEAGGLTHALPPFTVDVPATP